MSIFETSKGIAETKTVLGTEPGTFHPKPQYAISTKPPLYSIMSGREKSVYRWKERASCKLLMECITITLTPG